MWKFHGNSAINIGRDNKNANMEPNTILSQFAHKYKHVLSSSQLSRLQISSTYK